MTKFKSGDRVVCVRDSDDGSFFGHPGEIFTVSEMTETHQEGRMVWFKEMPAFTTGVDPMRFELVKTEESDLEFLITTANAGMRAEHLLLSHYVDKVQRKHNNDDDSRWCDFTHNLYNGYSVYREKPKPVFTPFYVGKKTCCWSDPIIGITRTDHTGPCTTGECLVRLDTETYKSLETSTLHIGSERFNAQYAMETLTALCKNKLAWYDEYAATRDGIEHKTAMNKKLSWADADRILAALESLGA